MENMPWCSNLSTSHPIAAIADSNVDPISNPMLQCSRPRLAELAGVVSQIGAQSCEWMVTIRTVSFLSYRLSTGYFVFELSNYFILNREIRTMNNFIEAITESNV